MVNALRWSSLRKVPLILSWILTMRSARSAVLLFLCRYRHNDNYADVRVMSRRAWVLWRGGVAGGLSSA